jgi:hypothetical protein
VVNILVLSIKERATMHGYLYGSERRHGQRLDDVDTYDFLGVVDFERKIQKEKIRLRLNSPTLCVWPSK